jgi:hypothetical protein
MHFDRASRRHFLRGLGASLTLPLLPSLMSRAEAQATQAALPRFFIALWHGHGGVHVDNAYPLDATVSLTTQGLYPAANGNPAHDLRFGRLVDLKRTHAQTMGSRSQALPDFDTGAARVSPLIGSFVSDALLAKMNVLRGIDFLTWGGHTRGFLGDFVNRDGDADNGLANVRVPTIDAVIGASSKFYAAGERALVKAPSLAVGADRISTYRSGAGVARNPYSAETLGDLFSLLFNQVQTTPGQVDPRASLVDRVHQDYVRTTRGAFGPGRRIGREDKLRLEEYVAGVRTIGDRLRATVSAGCSVPTVSATQRPLYYREGEADWEWGNAPSGTAARQLEARQALELSNALLVSAMQCGSTRVVVRMLSSLKDQWNPAVFNTASQFEGHRTDSHAMCFHNHFMEDRQRIIMETQRFNFEFGFVDLCRRLDATQVVPGVTMLDQALVYWSAESGPSTHDAKSVPAILAGSAGGFFRTGHYVDFTNRARAIRARYGNMWRAGIPQNRLLANVCQAMGLDATDYELSDAAYATKFPGRGGRVPGYGDPFVEGGDDRVPYLPAQIADMSAKLPIVTT